MISDRKIATQQKAHCVCDDDGGIKESILLTCTSTADLIVRGWEEKAPPTYLIVASHCQTIVTLVPVHMRADKRRHPQKQLARDAEEDVEQRNDKENNGSHSQGVGCRLGNNPVHGDR